MRFTDDVLTAPPLFARQPERAGAFDVERVDGEVARFVMREPHFANNVRYVLVLSRRSDSLRAHWADSEDTEPRGWLEIGQA